MRTISSPRRIPGALAILLAMGGVLAVAWALLLPPLQGPDESAHIAAVTRLVEHGQVVGGDPGLPRELLVLSREGGLGPLIGNVAARPAWTAEDRRRADRALERLGSRRAEFVDTADGPPTRGTARNPPLYAVYAAVPYLLARNASLLDRLALMRLWNVPLLLVTITCCWLLAAELLPRAPLAPVLAGALAALQPELGFITGVVNPDNLLIALISVFCLQAARLVRHGASGRRLAWLGAVVLAAMATHPRGAALVPCAAVAIALALPWRSLDRARRRRMAVAIGAGVLIVGAGAALVASAAGLDRAETTLKSSQGFSPRQFVSYVWQFYLPRLPFMDPSVGGDYGFRQAWIETAWGAFASLEVRFGAWVYTVIEIALVLAVIGAAVRARGRDWRYAALLGTVVVVTVFVLHVTAYRLLLVEPSDPIVVGRQLLVLIAPLAALVALAVTGLRPRVAQPVAALVVGGLVALDLAALGLTAIRFYA
jgi:predicted membrane protein DUF2142